MKKIWNQKLFLPFIAAMFIVLVNFNFVWQTPIGIKNDYLNKIVYEDHVGYGSESGAMAQELFVAEKESIIEFNIEPYVCSCINHNYSSVSETQNFLKEHRENQRDYYTSENSKILQEIGLDELNVITISAYSPHVILNFNEDYDYESFIDKANYVQKNKKIKKIYLTNIKKATSEATIASQYPIKPYNFAAALDDINLPSNVSGTGINVGILETGGNLNVNHTNFVNRQIIRRDITTSSSSHANIVGSIAVGNDGIAPNANIICSQTTTNIVNDMNWLISKNVNVINMSYGYSSNYGEYSIYDALMDYYSRFSFVTIVKSAGNRGDSDAKVTAPGNGYNVITVGATNVDKEIAYFSSYVSNRVKPTVVAPGTSLNNIPNIPNVIGGHNGTSYSAPMVTGGIALMMEKNASMVFSPELVISCLTLMAKKLPSSTSVMDNQAGAGLLDVAQASTIASFAVCFNVQNNNVGNVVASKPIIVLKNQKVRISTAWLVNSRQSSLSGSNLASPTDYDVRLKDSSGKVVASSAGLNNIEIFEYTSPNGSSIQTFTIEVYQYSNKPNSYIDYGTITSWYA